MKIMNEIRKYIRSKRPATIAEIMEKDELMLALERDYTEERTHEIAGCTFKVLWAVVNVNDGYKLVKDGFTTKGECHKFAESVDFVPYCYPYEVEI